MHGNTVSAPPHNLDSPPGPSVIVDGDEYLYFGGTGYLGLQRHPEVIRAAKDAVEQFGIHTATSRTNCVCPALVTAEAAVADYFGTETALLLPSGYASAQAVVQAVANDYDAFFLDADAHYALHDAAALAGRPTHAFASRDARALEESLQRNLSPNERPLVLTDGVFASSGWLSPVRDYVRCLAAWPGAGLVLDDAHGVGCLGDNGRGVLDHAECMTRANVLDQDGVYLYWCATASKALGGYGGIVAGDAGFVGRVRHASHWHDGATPLPAAMAAATARSVALAEDPTLRSNLKQNVIRVRDGLRDLGLSVPQLPSPIVGLSTEEPRAMKTLHADLLRRGVLVPLLSSYSGVDPGGVLRITVFADHTTAMIDRLLDE